MNVTAISTDNIRRFDLEDATYNLMSVLDADFERTDPVAITGNSENTYFSYRVKIEGLSFRSCTCSDYRFQLPRATDIISEESTMEDLAEVSCKHIEDIDEPDGGDEGEDVDAEPDTPPSQPSIGEYDDPLDILGEVTQ